MAGQFRSLFLGAKTTTPVGPEFTAWPTEIEKIVGPETQKTRRGITNKKQKRREELEFVLAWQTG